MATTHWEEIRAYLSPELVREVEGGAPEDEEEEDEEDAGEDEPDERDEEGEGEAEEPTPAAPGSQPYSEALQAAADAAPASVSAVALSNPALTVARWLDSLHRRAERPGSVLPLVFVLLFLIFAMVPVNGSATRFELIWRALTGGAALPPSATEVALAQQYQDLAAEQQTQATVASATWGAMWGVAGTLGIP